MNLKQSEKIKLDTANINKAINTLIDCLDEFGDGTITTPQQALDIITNLIDILGNYPKPRKKKSKTIAPDNLIGAYLYTSTARNALKLSLIGYIEYIEAITTAKTNIELSYSLLVD